MNWIKVDKDDLPIAEVIAINKHSKFITGYLYLNKHNEVCCQNFNQDLYDITHYCLIIYPNE